MKTITLTIPAVDIMALTIVAPTENTRPELNGIHFEIGRNETRLVATDGHRIIAIRHEQYLPDAVDVGDVIKVTVPTRFFEFVDDTGYSVQIDFDGREVTVQQPYDGEEDVVIRVESGGVIPESYPDWRRVVPAEYSGETAQFNPSYIGDFGNISELYTMRPTLYVRHNGTGAALCDIGVSHVFALLMPYVPEDYTPSQKNPSWLFDKLSDAGSDLV